ncbi:hypothetical protein BGZ81_009347 [Podila clonocystis]|nr:hypothetical protein BGZ81_009347 [Podila clonocystis]
MYPSKKAEPTIADQPKRLPLHCLYDPVICTWIWHACGQVQGLEQCAISDQCFTRVVKAVRDSMLSLNLLKFVSVPFGSDIRFNDQKVKRVLTAGAETWKALHCGSVSCLGPQALNTVLQHTATLAEFFVARAHVSSNITRLLKACPTLRVFKGFGGSE